MTASGPAAAISKLGDDGCLDRRNGRWQLAPGGTEHLLMTVQRGTCVGALNVHRVARTLCCPVVVPAVHCGCQTGWQREVGA